VYFYELHEGDEEVFSDVLLAREDEMDADDFFELVESVRHQVQDSYTDDTLIEIQVDGQGRMVDYSVLQGQVTSDVGSFLLFATYTPATMFLQPTSGRIVIRRSRIVVKG